LDPDGRIERESYAECERERRRRPRLITIKLLAAFEFTQSMAAAYTKPLKTIVEHAWRALTRTNPPRAFLSIRRGLLGL
jgi:hypothetical protein